MIDYDQAKAIVADAVARGIAKMPDPEIEEPEPPAGKRENAMPKTYPVPRKMCPKCERMIKTICGKVIQHHRSENDRGYGVGDWCSYNEVGL